MDSAIHPLNNWDQTTKSVLPLVSPLRLCGTERANCHTSQVIFPEHAQFAQKQFSIWQNWAVPLAHWPIQLASWLIASTISVTADDTSIGSRGKPAIKVWFCTLSALQNGPNGEVVRVKYAETWVISVISLTKFCKVIKTIIAECIAILGPLDRSFFSC